MDQQESARCTVDSAGVGLITTGQPGGRWNPALVRALARCIGSAMADPSVRAFVVLLGSRLGVCELDTSWLRASTLVTRGQAALESEIAFGDELARRISESSKPIVAVIDGVASGPVAELALACTQCVAASEAGTRLAFNLGKLGLPPMLGAAERLSQRVGAATAASLIADGKDILVEQGLKLALIDQAVPRTRLLDLARARAVQLCAAATCKASTVGTFPEGVSRFVQAAFGDVSRAMVSTLVAGVERANRLERRPADVARKTFHKVGVLGAGLMGSGIACVCAKAGMQVVLIDVDQASAERGLATLRKQEDAAIAMGREDAQVSAAWLARITPSERYESLVDVDIVVEAVFESRDVKASATRLAEAAMASTALYATNTSTLPIGSLARASVRPERFIGLHFFSPVPRMPLLEIIRGAKTSDTTLAQALDFAQAIGKTPIVVADHRGFYTSRVIMTYQAEAFEMLAEGVAPELIERAGKATGMPLPPLLLSDAVALDLIHQINLQTRRDTGSVVPPTRAQEIVGAMVERHGRLGKKNGKGFYDYGEQGRKSLWPALEEAVGTAAQAQPPLEELRDRLIGIQALEAARCLDEGVIDDPMEGDVGALLGWNFAPWTGGPLAYVDGQGVAAFVARCDDFAARLGERFRVPDSLRRIALDGGTVHSANWSRV